MSAIVDSCFEVRQTQKFTPIYFVITFWIRISLLTVTPLIVLASTTAIAACPRIVRQMASAYVFSV